MSDNRTFHLMYADERTNIQRTTTESFDEAMTVAKVMSRSSNNYNAMIIMVCDDYNYPLAFVYDGELYFSEKKINA